MAKLEKIYIKAYIIKYALTQGIYEISGFIETINGTEYLKVLDGKSFQTLNHSIFQSGNGAGNRN